MGPCPSLPLSGSQGSMQTQGLPQFFWGRAIIEWRTCKNFSSPRKFSEFLHQICTAGLLNLFLLLPPDTLFSIPLQSSWKWIKLPKSLQLPFYPDPMRRECLCLETQCGQQEKCQVATHWSYFASYSLHFHPHFSPSSSGKEQKED